MILNNAFGMKEVDCLEPEYKSMKTEGSCFDNTETLLYASSLN